MVARRSGTFEWLVDAEHGHVEEAVKIVAGEAPLPHGLIVEILAEGEADFGTRPRK